MFLRAAILVTCSQSSLLVPSQVPERTSQHLHWHGRLGGWGKEWVGDRFPCCLHPRADGCEVEGALSVSYKNVSHILILVAVSTKLAKLGHAAHVGPPLPAAPIPRAKNYSLLPSIGMKFGNIELEEKKGLDVKVTKRPLLCVCVLFEIRSDVHICDVCSL